MKDRILLLLLLFMLGMCISLSQRVSELSNKLDHYEELILENHKTPDTLKIGNISVKIDDRANRVLIKNPTGNVEVYCAEMWVNGVRIDD